MLQGVYQENSVVQTFNRPLGFGSRDLSQCRLNEIPYYIPFRKGARGISGKKKNQRQGERVVGFKFSMGV